MKKFVSLFVILMTFISAYSQGYQQDIYVNSNQSKSKQYIGIALGGKKVLSSERLEPTKYDKKGKFSSVYLPDFADALAEYLEISTAENVGEQIADSLSGIDLDLPFYELIFTLTRDVGEETFDLDTIYNSFPGEFTLTGQSQIWNGFQIDYDGCGEDGVDCSAVEGNNRLVGSSPSGWAVIRATANGFMYILPYANTDSFAFSCFRADGTQCQDADFSSGFVYQFHLRYMIDN